MWIQDLLILNMSLSASLLTVTTFGLCGALLVVLSAAPCVSTLQDFCLALITMFLLAVHCCEGCFLKVAWKEDGGAFKQGRLKPGISSWKEVQGRGSLHLTSEQFSVTNVRAKWLPDIWPVRSWILQTQNSDRYFNIAHRCSNRICVALLYLYFKRVVLFYI